MAAAATMPNAEVRARQPLGKIALWLVLAAQLVVVLDFSIVNVALPSLGAELHVSSSGAEWVITGYALTFGGLLILGGRASDLFGRRRILLVGLLVFAGASAAGGLAPSITVLVAARVIQGGAGALVAPAGLSILTTSYPEGRERNRVLGYYGITASVGFVLGLVAGGILVDTVGWRAVFFVNVPLCLVMAAATPLLPSSEAAASRRLDAVSATLATLGMAALVLAPTFATNDGLVSLEFLGCVAASGVLFVLFVAYERDATDPLVPLSIFRHRALVAGDVVAALLGAWTAAEVLVLALYCQEVLGYSPLVSGLIVVPQGIGGILRGVAGPRVIARVGIRAFLAGSCALSAVCLLFLFRFPVTSRYPLLGVVLLGLGFATTSAIYGATVAGSSGVPNEDQGVAGGLINASRQIGAAIGVAVLLSIVGSGAVSTTQLASRYRAGLAGAGVLAVVATFVGLAAPRRTPGEGDRRHGLASSASSARA